MQTLNQIKIERREAREAGDEINMIYSKSLFRNRDHLKRQLAYKRLIHFDLDKDEFLIIDGTDRGPAYQAKKVIFCSTMIRLNVFLITVSTCLNIKKFMAMISMYRTGKFIVA